jgi:hypothetical protein
MGSTSPLFAMFEAIISEPASPKPRASSEPIFIIAFSITIVSSWSTSSYCFASFSSLAIKGFLAIWLTLSIMRSRGASASSFANLKKYIFI